jgi:phosphoglycerol transferase MdoB-like AlkP superfamily enzyme
MKDANQQQDLKLNALHMQMNEHLRKFNYADSQFKQSQKKLEHKARWNTIWKGATVAAFITGLIIN